MSFLRALILLLLIAPMPTARAQSFPRRVRLPETLKEISGMARLPNGDWWVLNDGGNAASLYRLDATGKGIAETRSLPCPNRDWEDLCADTQGNLYIADVGNNFNQRHDLCVFRYHPVTEALDSILFSYPDQRDFPPSNARDWNYDCEALVFFHDSLHLFSKNRFKSNHIVKHYVIPAKPGHYVAELRESIRLKNRVVSGAAMSSDGKTLALTTYILGFKLGFIPFSKASAFYFTDFKGSVFFNGNKKKVRLPKFLIARQFESILEWKPGCWLAANEGIGPQKQSVWRVKR
ncbi:MAG: hypothetical protein JNM22_11415 [Saprospiraceae bacterium]|nr:hypothetical protein [Saprospiraceae bacterium]